MGYFKSSPACRLLKNHRLSYKCISEISAHKLAISWTTAVYDEVKSKEETHEAHREAPKNVYTL
jgi:hypothetical protein